MPIKKRTYDRGEQLIRLIRVALMSSSRGFTARELADRLHVSNKTIYRDWRVIERAGIPTYYDERPDGSRLFRVDRHFMQGFLTPLSRLTSPLK